MLSFKGKLLMALQSSAAFLRSIWSSWQPTFIIKYAMYIRVSPGAGKPAISLLFIWLDLTLKTSLCGWWDNVLCVKLHTIYGIELHRGSCRVQYGKIPLTWQILHQRRWWCWWQLWGMAQSLRLVFGDLPTRNMNILRKEIFLESNHWDCSDHGFDRSARGRLL